MKKQLIRLIAVSTAFSLFLSLFTVMVSPSVSVKAASGKIVSIKAKSGSDITDALQKALTDAAGKGTKKKPATVKIPAGTFYISNTIFIGSNTKLVLNSKTVIKKNEKAKVPVAYMLRCAGDPSKRTCTKGGYSDSANITISGGTWDAGFIKCNDDSSGSVFSLSHTTNLTVSGVTIRNCFGTHLIELAAAKKVTIKNCSLYGFKASDSKTEKEAIQLDVCHDEKLMPSGAPYDDTPCSDITVTKCKIHDYPRAIGSHIMVDKIYHKNIKITGNDIYDISGAAIYGYNYVSLTVKNNTIKNVGCAIQVKSDSDVSSTKRERLSGVKAMSLPSSGFNISITGNTITTAGSSDSKDDSKSLMGIFIYGSEKAPVSGVTISDNEINSASSAVYLRFVKDSKILNNKLMRSASAFDAAGTSFSEDAVKLSSSTVSQLDGNTIGTHSKPFENGIALRDASTVKSSKTNTVSEVTDCALALYSGSSFTGSDFHALKAGKHGITIDGSKATITGSEVRNAAQNGITLKDSSTLVFNSSTVSDTEGHGISLLSGSSLEMDDSTVTRYTKNGLNASASDIKFTDSTFSSGSGKGMSIGSGSVADIRGCVISGNTDTALKCEGSQLTLYNCTFSSNTAVALRVTGSKLLAHSNFFNNNSVGEKVVFISDKSTGVLSCSSMNNPGAKRDVLISSDSNISTVLTDNSIFD